MNVEPLIGIGLVYTPVAIGNCYILIRSRPGSRAVWVQSAFTHTRFPPCSLSKCPRMPPTCGVVSLGVTPGGNSERPILQATMSGVSWPPEDLARGVESTKGSERCQRVLRLSEGEPFEDCLISGFRGPERTGRWPRSGCCWKRRIAPSITDPNVLEVGCLLLSLRIGKQW